MGFIFSVQMTRVAHLLRSPMKMYHGYIRQTAPIQHKRTHQISHLQTVTMMKWQYDVAMCYGHLPEDSGLWISNTGTIRVSC